MLGEPNTVAPLTVRNRQHSPARRQQRLTRRKKIIRLFAKRKTGYRVAGFPTLVFAQECLLGDDLKSALRVAFSARRQARPRARPHAARSSLALWLLAV